jgi:hypothetical protein
VLCKKYSGEKRRKSLAIFASVDLKTISAQGAREKKNGWNAF